MMLTRLSRLLFAAGAAAQCTGFAFTTVTVSNMSPPASDTISPLLFGVFQEEHWGDLVPGIWEQYIVNPSFEDWYVHPTTCPHSPTHATGQCVLLKKTRENKTREVFIDEVTIPGGYNPATAGIGHPWEAIPGNTATLTRESGPNNFRNTAKSQRIRVDPTHLTGGVLQKVALPHQRSGQYELRFWARRDGPTTITVKLTHDNHTVIHSQVISGISTGATFSLHTVTLNLTIGTLAALPWNSPFGAAKIWFEVTTTGATGHLWVDQVTLTPTNSVGFVSGVAGGTVGSTGRTAFNPDTIKYMRDVAKVKALRWPGGNFSSIYHWRDGIGDRDDRLTRPNLAWGGLMSNEMGIDEFMAFCTLIGATPIIGAPFNGGDPVSTPSTDARYLPAAQHSYWDSPYNLSAGNPYDPNATGFYHVTAPELADWVEYCNGLDTTIWGAQRKANRGNIAAPYGIEFWGVGNEVYGNYQFGSPRDSLLPITTANVENYMALLETRARAMKLKASKKSDFTTLDIKVIASGLGVHNTLRNSDPHPTNDSRPDTWSEDILGSDTLWNSGAGGVTDRPLLDYLDLHHYVYGPDDSVDPYFDYLTLGGEHEKGVRSLFGSTRNLEALYTLLQTQRPGVKFFHTEWAVLPEKWNNPDYVGKNTSPRDDTFANAIATAAHYNAFIRNSDKVVGANLHNFSLNSQAVEAHCSPPYPRTLVTALYADRLGGKRRLALTVATDASYTFDGQHFPEIGDLSYAGTAPTYANDIDVVAALSAEGESVDLVVVNRNRTDVRDVKIELPTGWKIYAGSSKQVFHSQPATGEPFEGAFREQVWADNSGTYANLFTVDAAVTIADATGDRDVNILDMPAMSIVHVRLDVGSPSAQNIVLDAPAVASGSWATDTSRANKYGTNYRLAAGTGIDVLRWTPNITSAGNYKVFYWLPDGDGVLASNAPYRVHWTGSGGGDVTKAANERANPGGQWVYLDTRNFTTGTGGYVELTDSGTNGGVVGDAVRFYKP